MTTPNRLLNVLANYAGVASTLVVHVLLVPVYVRFLGAETFGLIGFFSTLQSVLQIMDLGLGMTLNRELARRTSVEHDSQDTADLVRTLEAMSWGIAAFIGIAVWALSEQLASRWLMVKDLSVAEVTSALGLMGLALALQWPNSIYTGGLLGLQRQAQAVAANAGANVVFAAGAILLLARWPSVTIFFFWRSIVSLGTVLVQRTALRSQLRARWGDLTAHVNRRTLSTVWRFSAGMTGVALTGIALVQLDKLIVSRTLTLDRFGVYMVASTAAALIPQLVNPIFTATLPALSQSSARADMVTLCRDFHLATQLICTVVHPVACAVAIFAKPLLLAWTADVDLATSAAPVLSILAFGGLLNSIMVPFYAVQLASGWTRLATFTNCVLIVVMIPYAAIAAQRWGATGAASTWLVLNGLYVVLGAALTLGRLLPGTLWLWLLRDIAKPLACSVTVIWLSSRLMMPVESSGWALPLIAVTTLLAIIAAAATSADMRRRVAEVLSRKHVSHSQ